MDKVTKGVVIRRGEEKSGEKKGEGRGRGGRRGTGAAERSRPERGPGRVGWVWHRSREV